MSTISRFGRGPYSAMLKRRTFHSELVEHLWFLETDGLERRENGDG